MAPRMDLRMDPGAELWLNGPPNEGRKKGKSRIDAVAYQWRPLRREGSGTTLGWDPVWVYSPWIWVQIVRIGNSQSLLPPGIPTWKRIYNMPSPSLSSVGLTSCCSSNSGKSEKRFPLTSDCARNYSYGFRKTMVHGMLDGGRSGSAHLSHYSHRFQKTIVHCMLDGGPSGSAHFLHFGEKTGFCDEPM